MILTRRNVSGCVTWFADEFALPQDASLGMLLGVGREEMEIALGAVAREGRGTWQLLSPVDDDQEVWAAGVTYLRSRDERQAESTVADVYGRVYEAERPELFFKSLGWRTVGSGQKIRIRRDSDWDVPEPELTLAVNRFGEIVGYTAGNDVSSRRIEGENPLYLPQAKTYDGSCAVGPGIMLCRAGDMENLPIRCSIKRAGHEVFAGEANTSQLKRNLDELVEYLMRETTFPRGVFLMTGTGIVPAEAFTLQPGDEVTIHVGELTLINEVDAHR